MREPGVEGVSALASLLIDAELLGEGAIKYGSPDLVIFNSGGPATHLARNSILCGPSKARIVVFAELPDGTSDFTISATRDNTTYNNITLTDTGFVTGSSGVKIYTGSTPLTGSASPQVQLRWKVVGASLSNNNKIHGVALQWA